MAPERPRPGGSGSTGRRPQSARVSPVASRQSAALSTLGQSGKMRVWVWQSKFTGRGVGGGVTQVLVPTLPLARATHFGIPVFWLPHSRMTLVFHPEAGRWPMSFFNREPNQEEPGFCGPLEDQGYAALFITYTCIYGRPLANLGALTGGFLQLGT